MAKIVFIGAGSLGFTRSLVRDVFTFPLLADDLTIGLVDIDPQRLEFSRRAVEKIMALGNYRAKVVCSTDRREVLSGADAVLVTILCGDVAVWKHDIFIPKKYGVDTNIGDTRGPSGVFRALRTIPEMLGICRDVQKLCPNAMLLNYTNPMAMNCNAMQRAYPNLKISGLCHSVQGTAGMIEEWLGVPRRQMDFVCAGINHLSWYLQLRHHGKDLYPALRKLVAANRRIYNIEQVRNEMLLHLGYYVTESSGHNSEYNWWFRKSPELIEKYCTHGTGWNPGKYAMVVDYYSERGRNWKKDVKTWLAKDKPIDLARGHEYAANIINAHMGGEPYKFNGNVPNAGLIDNLPQGCCVEVPVLATRLGLEAIHVGPLPLPVLPLTAGNAAIETMAATASLTGDEELVHQALQSDPLSAAVLSMRQIRRMTEEMFRRNRPYLPQFKKSGKR
jgi:alpha-galactosidase